MVIQKCKRCSEELATDMRNVANYCMKCGAQCFTLRPESSAEKKLKFFNGKRQGKYIGKIWRGK